MDIKSIVKKTIRKHDSKNPFEIAKSMGIIVLFEPLGDYTGYYNKAYRQRMIHINENLSEEEQLFTCAHELGHAVLHSNCNTPFMRKNTGFFINKFEREANTFACHLLLNRFEQEELKELTIEQISLMTGIPSDFLHLTQKTNLLG